MKKIYLTSLAVLAMCFTANAQLDFNFDNFSLGDVVGQASEIVLWPAAGVTSSQVTTEQAFSGDRSVVTREQDGTNVDDILINLGNQNSGVWSVSWMMYAPAGATGFWNIQNDETFTATSEAQWNGQFFLNEGGGAAGEVSWDQGDEVVAYPEDTWFSVVHVIDFDNPDGTTHTLVIDGNTLLDAVDFEDTDNADPAPMLGAINYFAIDADNRYYVDDFSLEQGNILSTDDFSTANFSIYPNPVKDVMNIESAGVVSNVTVYDVLGKVVLQSTPNVASPSINTSALSSGAYLVNVTVDGATKTVKVIK